MTTLTSEHPPRGEPRTRGRLHLFWDITFSIIRYIARRVHGAYVTFGFFLLAGTAVAAGATWLFAEIAEHVMSGGTEAFDEAVLHWIAAHRSPIVTRFMLEMTSLGTGLLVMVTVVVSALFLWVTRHRHSAALLLIASAGGLVLNGLLKLGFARPRPQVFEWGTHVVSSSFPSGHAMNAVIVYGTVAYLVARLQSSHATRVLTFGSAGVVIVLVCVSRVYLGVHYPSDVLAGLVVGLGWAAFCMTTLEAVQLYARRNAPQLLEHEHPAPAPAPARHAHE